jgi:hypothetical protein
MARTRKRLELVTCTIQCTSLFRTCTYRQAEIVAYSQTGIGISSVLWDTFLIMGFSVIELRKTNCKIEQNEQ